MKTSELIGILVSGGSMGKLNQADSTKQMIAEITAVFGITETHLAGFLGVTEKSLNEWKGRQMGDLPPKAFRLTQLHKVMLHIQSKHSEVPENMYKPLIENGRVPFDSGDEDYDSISLVGLIKADPQSKLWMACVDHVINEYKETTSIAPEKMPRESNRSIQGPA